MKRLKYLVFICLIINGVSANAGTVLESGWKDVVSGNCSDQGSGWWSSAEAIRIAENVLLYQKAIGGWPKNINMQLVLTDTQKQALVTAQPNNEGCTIDNNATMLELLYLSKVHQVLPDGVTKTKIREGFLKGVQYLLKAQYSNGGWPQFYPYRGGYSDHITYNDNAMINVLNVLRHIYSKDSYYSVTVHDTTITAAANAFAKGLDCILKTQYIQNGRPTVWCAQHHKTTLVPVMARSYELASLSGGESAGIILLLMSLNQPSNEVKRAVHYAVEWYKKTEIKGIRVEKFTNTDGLSDVRVVNDASAANLWARFYTLEDNRPFFSDRDGIMKFSLAEIGYERRTNYSWYGSYGSNVLSTYLSWKTNWGTNIKEETLITLPLPKKTFYTTDTVPVKAYTDEFSTESIQSFELIFNGQLLKSDSISEIDTILSGLTAGNYEIVAKATYKSGHIATDTSKFSVTKLSDLPPSEIAKTLKCYPNPAQSRFTVDLGEINHSLIRIYNMYGQLVYKTTTNVSILQINDHGLSPGHYLITATDNHDNSLVERLLIK
ncbi:MAG: pectate lyase [Bacteroidales bacterium]